MQLFTLLSVLRRWPSWLLPLATLVVVMLASCAPAAPTPALTRAATAPPAPSNSAASEPERAAATPTSVLVSTTPASEVPVTATIASTPDVPSTATATATPQRFEVASPVPAPDVGAGRPALIIDHTAVVDFARIPDEYIARAAQLSFLFRGASVGANINDGLNCLMNDFPNRRPNFCDRGLAPEQVVFDRRLDRSRWLFEPHSPPPNPNPGWWNKVTFFADRVNSMGPDDYDVVTFTFDYVDVIEGGNMDDLFFQAERSGDLPIVQDLADLEAAHPDKRFVWWTSNLARSVGTADAESFNQQMRDYAAAHGKVLFDMAAIESHAPDGSPCFDNRGQGYPAICPDYTDEREAGHLNALGRQRVSQALWVLMARLAGWEG